MDSCDGMFWTFTIELGVLYLDLSCYIDTLLFWLFGTSRIGHIKPESLSCLMKFCFLFCFLVLSYIVFSCHVLSSFTLSGHVLSSLVSQGRCGVSLCSHWWQLVTFVQIQDDVLDGRLSNRLSEIRH